jgi:hypothetical protein
MARACGLPRAKTRTARGCPSARAVRHLLLTSPCEEARPPHQSKRRASLKGLDGRRPSPAPMPIRRPGPIYGALSPPTPLGFVFARPLPGGLPAQIPGILNAQVTSLALISRANVKIPSCRGGIDLAVVIKISGRRPCLASTRARSEDCCGGNERDCHSIHFHVHLLTRVPNSIG